MVSREARHGFLRWQEVYEAEPTFECVTSPLIVEWAEKRMCGIFGIIASRVTLKAYGGVERLTDQLFRLSESRGRESAGLAARDPSAGTITVLKKPVSASRLIRDPDYRRLLCDIGSGVSRTASAEPVAIIGHTRLVTNGKPDDHGNNQPVVKNDAVVVHNGIIVNVDTLWAEMPAARREHEVDTEIIPVLIQQELDAGQSPHHALAACFGRLEGTASFAMMRTDWDQLLLATNNGSLYVLSDGPGTFLTFSSERFILLEWIRRVGLERHAGPCHIEWIRPNTGGFIGLSQVSWVPFYMDQAGEPKTIPGRRSLYRINQVRESRPAFSPARRTGASVKIDDARLRRLLVNPVEAIDHLRRCSRCILPETFPFIVYDADGVCNYCRHYRSMVFQGPDALVRRVAPYRRGDGQPDCIVTFSGGRDSSYGLHYVREVLKLTPIAYTYDWGMVTDLGRRNQARLCGKLGVEHILVSADIARKRANIRRNVSAWLRRPQLGTIPLFMAGDKQYFYYANLLSRRNGIRLVVLCENMLETTHFKSGFCGIRPSHGAAHTYTLSVRQKLRLMAYYGIAFLCNPAYLNRSLRDTIGAFLSYYAMPHDYLNLYEYISWDEGVIESLLRDTYHWETAPDTPSTWRIGDGTAAFYNYIYYTVAGFSEVDTFRSNQIREGMLTHDRALSLAREENRPRYESLLWYLDTIGLEFESTLRAINDIPRLYPVS